LPTLRVNPSRARCAVASGGLSQASGGVPSTMTRPEGSSVRAAGWKNAKLG
jgi:hypothetical protein